MARIDDLKSMRTALITGGESTLCMACICRDAERADRVIEKIENYSDRITAVIVVPQDYPKVTRKNIILIHCDIFKTSIMRSLIVYTLRGLNVRYVWFVDDDDDFTIGDISGLRDKPWYSIIKESAALWGYVFRKDLLIQAYESLREPELLIQEDSIVVEYFRNNFGTPDNGLQLFMYNYDQDASHYVPCATLTEYLSWCKKMLLNVDYIMEFGDIWGLVAALWQKAKGVSCQRDRLKDLIYMGLQIANMKHDHFEKIKYYVDGFIGGIYGSL